MEGITVYLKPTGSTEYEQQFYSILTTEKEQDGRIVYANTKIVLEHIKRELLIEEPTFVDSHFLKG